MNRAVTVMLVCVGMLASAVVYAAKTYQCPVAAAVVITQSPVAARPYGYKGIVVVNDFKRRGLIATGRGKSCGPAAEFYGAFVTQNGLLVCGYTERVGGSDPAIVVMTKRSVIEEDEDCTLDGQNVKERVSPCQGSIGACTVICTKRF